MGTKQNKKAKMHISNQANQQTPLLAHSNNGGTFTRSTQDIISKQCHIKKVLLLLEDLLGKLIVSLNYLFNFNVPGVLKDQQSARPER